MAWGLLKELSVSASIYQIHSQIPRELNTSLRSPRSDRHLCPVIVIVLIPGVIHKRASPEKTNASFCVCEFLFCFLFFCFLAD